MNPRTLTIAMAGFSTLMSCGQLDTALPGTAKSFGVNRLAAARIASPDQLFLAADSQGIRKRFFQSTDGDLGEVAFEDDQGNPNNNVTVNLLRPVSTEFAAVELTAPTGERLRALMRLSDGKLFDISKYSIEGMQVHGDQMYTVTFDGNAGTLHRIDLTTLTATPLNNPSFDPIAKITFSTAIGYGTSPNNPLFLVGNGLNVLAYAHDWQIYLFPKGGIPRSTNDRFNNNIFSGPGTSGALLYGEDGFIYQIRLGHDKGDTIRRINLSENGVTFTDTVIGVHFEFDTYRMTRSHYTLESRQRYLLFSHGFYTINPVPRGGFTAHWTSKTMPPTIPTGEGYASEPFVYGYISGDFVYWKTGNTIRRIRFAVESAEELLVSENNIIRMNVISGVVYYSKYLSATHIATYRVQPGGAAELIEESEMAIEQVVEVSSARGSDSH